jgi:hypothetical protein
MFEISPEESSSLAAAMCMLAQEAELDSSGLPQTEAEILAVMGVDQGETNEMRDQLLALMAAVVEESRQAPPAERIHHAVRGFAGHHRDAISDTGGHRTYSDDFRDFVLEMMGPGEPGEGMSPAEMASATGVVPLEILEDWLRSQAGRGTP